MSAFYTRSKQILFQCSILHVSLYRICPKDHQLSTLLPFKRKSFLFLSLLYMIFSFFFSPIVIILVPVFSIMPQRKRLLWHLQKVDSILDHFFLPVRNRFCRSCWSYAWKRYTSQLCCTWTCVDPVNSIQSFQRTYCTVRCRCKLNCELKMKKFGSFFVYSIQSNVQLNHERWHRFLYFSQQAEIRHTSPAEYSLSRVVS